MTEQESRIAVSDVLGEFDNWPGTGYHYDELLCRLAAMLWEADRRASEGPARYRDGLPQNISAAANDSLEWLRWLEIWRHRQEMSNGEFARLHACITALETYLAPHLPAVYEETKE